LKFSNAFSPNDVTPTGRITFTILSSGPSTCESDAVHSPLCRCHPLHAAVAEGHARRSRCRDHLQLDPSINPEFGASYDRPRVCRMRNTLGYKWRPPFHIQNLSPQQRFQRVQF
jgi:hypothetical protein